MINPDRVELLIAALVGAVFGIVTGVLLKHGRVNIVIWALIGAVVVTAAVYCYRAIR
jgi:ribose/xylose/arabinose/galactoside ABC-type transport system permease subunit